MLASRYWVNAWASHARPGHSLHVGARNCAVLLACVGLALTLGVAALFASSAPSFARARSYPTGTFPASVAIGDLNGDGKPDLATANLYADTDSVLLNRGDGSFRARRDYRTGNQPVAVAIGDLNGDEKPDLATANGGEPGSANTVSVLTNKGDGTFQARRAYRTGAEPDSVAIGDLNGDGMLDIVTANVRANTVSVLTNKGDGSFQSRLDYGTGRYPSSAAIGDLNGDGKPDLVTANAGAVSVLLNRGDGSFQAKREFPTRGGWSVAIGDLNGDSKPDLATVDPHGIVSVLANRGDGSFRVRRDYRTANQPVAVAIGDLNGDDKPDLATANGWDGGDDPDRVTTLSVLANTGDGNFRARLDYRTGGVPVSIAIGDLNGDSKPDLAATNFTGSIVSVLLNRPGLCTVQDVKRQTVPAAKRTIARANCRVGKIRRAYSKTVKRGRVISEKPKPGAVLPSGDKVNLVVSRGRKPS